jgi:hypothetical protein
MSNAVYCIAPTRAAAEGMVDSLKNAGFANSEISVLMADKGDTKEFARDQDTKVPERAAAGAGAGVGIGAILGWLAGIGSLAIPGVGPFIAAGPIMGALGGAAAGGTVGGLIGALTGMGVPEEHAKSYDSRVRTGGVLVSVHTESMAQIAAAKEIFRRGGGESINSTGAAV